MEQLGQFFPLVLILIVGYFFMIRPQMKRQKDEKNYLAAIKKGDKVITKSGLYGKIVDLNDNDNTCVIETMAGRLKFDRTALSMEGSKKLNPSESK